MTSAFQRINDSVAAVDAVARAAGTARDAANRTAASASGKFSFSPDEIEGIAKDWLDLALEYTDSLRTANRLRIAAPGNEEASENNMRQGIDSWKLYLQSLEEKQRYSTEQAQKFYNALCDYNGTERVNVHEMTKVGPSTPGGI